METEVEKPKSSDAWRLETKLSLYVTAKIRGQGITMLVDSGAEKTILSLRAYVGIPSHKRFTLTPTNQRFGQADGTAIETWGTAWVELSIGPISHVMRVTVANVRNEGILGMDFLTERVKQFDFERRELVTAEGRIKCKTVDDESFCVRVVATEDIEVPEGHEIVVFGKPSHPLVPSDWAILEPVETGSLQTKGIGVARAVVGNVEMVPVRLLNAQHRAHFIRKGTAIATLTPLMDGSVQSIRTISELTESSEDLSQELEATLPEHLVDLYDRSTEELGEDEQGQVHHLLLKYDDVFSKGDHDLGRTKLVKHTIETGTATPIRQPLRRLPLGQREEVERQVKDLLKKDAIQPSSSPWSSPVVLVSKKDGSKRLCIDYRRLNAVSKKDAFPLPRIDDTLDSLSDARWFCTLDLAAGYWQVEMDSDARQKSAFSTNSGLYEWNVMPFGLCNAPATFERLMERILAGLHWETLLVYLDDIIVYGRTVEETNSRLEEVFKRMRLAGLKLKPSKCQLFRTQVDYLGHVVSAAGIQTDPAKVEAVKHWPTPKTQTQVRSFLGLASYYRRFIQDFAGKARPLQRLTEKNVAFKWDSDCDEAFGALKAALTSAPILAYPMPNGQFILDTDASAFALDAVLSQEQEGTERVVAYASKSLKRAERNYCVTRREMLAVINFLKKFKHYLWGRKVRVRTDHASLRWLCGFKNPEGQLARWLEVLGCYDLEVIHRPGRLHQNADSLSRRPCPQCGRVQGKEGNSNTNNDDRVTKEENSGTTNDDQMPNRDKAEPNGSEKDGHPSLILAHTVELPTATDLKVCDTCDEPQQESVPETVLPQTQRSTPPLKGILVGANAPRSDKKKTVRWNLATLAIEAITAEPTYNYTQIREEQLKDDTMAPLIPLLENQQARPPWENVSPGPPALKTYWAQWNLLAIRDNVLCRKWESADGMEIKWLVVLPTPLRHKVLQELHDSKSAGHMGEKKTLLKVRSRYFWTGMNVDVRAHVRKCNGCAQKKGPQKKRRAPLHQYKVGGPLERIAIDILGPLPQTEDGHVYVLVVGDYHTKWVEAYPLPDQTAETVANRLFEDFVCRFGVPLELHSDQGRNFEANVFQELCRLLGIEKTRTTAYNPKSDGMIERFNRTIANAVSLMLEPVKRQRDWDRYLPHVGLAYRSCVHETTGESPNMMMLGRETKLPVDLMVEGPPGEEDCDTDYAEEMRERIRLIHQRAREVISKNMRKQKKHYDRRAEGGTFKVGEFVWLLQKARKPGLTKKLALPWEGPYLVVKVLTDVVLRIQKSPRSKPVVVHRDRLKPYQGTPIKPWISKKPSSDDDVVEEMDEASSSAPEGPTTHSQVMDTQKVAEVETKGPEYVDESSATTASELITDYGSGESNNQALNTTNESDTDVGTSSGGSVVVPDMSAALVERTDDGPSTQYDATASEDTVQSSDAQIIGDDNSLDESKAVEETDCRAAMSNKEPNLRRSSRTKRLPLRYR